MCVGDTRCWRTEECRVLSRWTDQGQATELERVARWPRMDLFLEGAWRELSVGEGLCQP